MDIWLCLVRNSVRKTPETSNIERLSNFVKEEREILWMVVQRQILLSWTIPARAIAKSESYPIT